jgi:hypothetical protein
MQTADDVEFGHSLAVTGGSSLPRFFQGHGVSAGAIFSAAEGAQPAGSHANVGWVDVAVDVEIGNVAVQAFADKVCQPSYGQDIAGSVESDAIVEIEALVCQDLFRDRPQTGIVGLKAVARRRKSNGAAHFFMILDRLLASVFHPATSKQGPMNSWVKI